MPGQGQEQQQEQEQAALALASAVHQQQQAHEQQQHQGQQHQGRDEEMKTPPITPFMLPCSVSPDESERPPPTDFQRMSLAMDKLRSDAIATVKRNLWAEPDA